MYTPGWGKFVPHA